MVLKLRIFAPYFILVAFFRSFETFQNVLEKCNLHFTSHLENTNIWCFTANQKP